MACPFFLSGFPRFAYQSRAESQRFRPLSRPCLLPPDLAREIKNLTHPKLLNIDEVGYLTLQKTHASLLFQAICEPYEKRQPIILTNNKAFVGLAQVFAGEVDSLRGGREVDGFTCTGALQIRNEAIGADGSPLAPCSCSSQVLPNPVRIYGRGNFRLRDHAR